MHLTSYAQNFEDVMLWRAFNGVNGGCYVDIGAQHPTIDSVSRVFYEHGWRGVHVEPVAEYATLLRQDRPDEIVLQLAFGATDAKVCLNVIPGTGLSTSNDAYARVHAEKLGTQYEPVEVAVTTMRSALQFLVGRDIHWLKIDVEGMEKDVLQGWDSQALRPWIIVVEAILPTSHESSHAAWEPLLEQAHYQFAYFDGLNRFYVADERAYLMPAFKVPPNVFDGFQLSGQASAEWCTGLNHHVQQLSLGAKQTFEDLQQMVNQVDTLGKQLVKTQEELGSVKSANSREINRLQAHIKQSQQAAEQLSAQIHVIYNSRTWQMTSLLRKTIHTGKTMFKAGLLVAKNPVHATRQTMRSGLVWTMRQVLSTPPVQSRTLAFLTRYPSVKHRLKLLAIKAGLIMDRRASAGMDNPLGVMSADGHILLPERATKIFAELKHAVNERTQ